MGRKIALAVLITVAGIALIRSYYNPDSLTNDWNERIFGARIADRLRPAMIVLVAIVSVACIVLVLLGD